MTSFTRHFIFIMLAVLGYVACIVYCTFKTIFIDGAHYRDAVSHLRIDSVSVRQIRGFIFSDNNELLAGSLPEYDLYLDFKSTTRVDKSGRMNITPLMIDTMFSANGPGSRAVAEVAHHRRSAAEYGAAVRNAYRSRLAKYPLLRTVSYLDYKRLRQMPYFSLSTYRNGLIPNERAHRYRPYGERRMASCVIGDVYANKDTVITIDGERYNYLGVGRSGLELACDSLLRGRPGWGYKKKIRTRMLEVTQVQPIHGANVHTTINVEMEDILDRALARRILDLHAAGGWAAVMEVETGQIKAISNLRRDGDECVEDHNHLFEDLIDPGSTFKTVSYMVLLDNDKITPETTVDTHNTADHPSHFNYHGKQIRDDHPVGEVTADEAICQSSNIAVAMLTTQAYESHPQDYLDAIYKTKIFDDLQLRGEFPKAQAARKRSTNDRTWSKVSLGQICYGYETQIPGIYMLNFYNAIANGGRLMRPYIIDYIEKDGDILYRQKPETINRKICKSETLKQIHHALLGVVEHGTAAGKPGLPGARSSKVKIAGKTGTAQRYENGTFSGTGHNVSFVGYFPADDPKYTCIVVINTKGSGYGRPGGGYMAGPVVRTLAEEIYALHGHRSLKSLPADTLHPFYPTVKGGIAADVAYVMDKLDLDASMHAERNDVAGVAMEEADHGRVDYAIEPRRAAVGTVPNVRGMGAADALYILEHAGLKVGLSGKGQVVSQSLPAGSSCRKGQYITITLK
jgi:cell division protein FtsI (penicillin-binding protein 3)